MGGLSPWACPPDRGVAASQRGPGGDDAGGRWGEQSSDGGRRARASKAKASSTPRAAGTGGFSPVLRHGRWACGERKREHYRGSPWGAMAQGSPRPVCPPSQAELSISLKGFAMEEQSLCLCAPQERCSPNAHCLCVTVAGEVRLVA